LVVYHKTWLTNEHVAKFGCVLRMVISDDGVLHKERTLDKI